MSYVLKALNYLFKKPHRVSVRDTQSEKTPVGNIKPEKVYARSMEDLNSAIDELTRFVLKADYDSSCQFFSNVTAMASLLNQWNTFSEEKKKASRDDYESHYLTIIQAVANTHNGLYKLAERAAYESIVHFYGQQGHVPELTEEGVQRYAEQGIKLIKAGKVPLDAQKDMMIADKNKFQPDILKSIRESIIKLLQEARGEAEIKAIQATLENISNGVLCYAAQRECPHLVKDFVTLTKLPVNEKDENGDTPLAIAIQAGSLKCVAVLNELGADWNAVNKKGETPQSQLLKEGHGLQVLINEVRVKPRARL